LNRPRASANGNPALYLFLTRNNAALQHAKCGPFMVA
jgi:hypothetical protein